MRACATPSAPRDAADLLCLLLCSPSKDDMHSRKSRARVTCRTTLPARLRRPPPPSIIRTLTIPTEPGSMIRHTHVLRVTARLTSPCLETGLNWERLPRRGAVGGAHQSPRLQRIDRGVLFVCHPCRVQVTA